MAVRHLLKRSRSLGKKFQRFLDDRSTPDSETDDYLKYQVDILYHHSVFISGTEEDETIHKIVSNLREVYHLICVTKEPSATYQAQHKLSGNTGRPKIEITQEQLEYLLEKGFTCPRHSNHAHCFCENCQMPNVWVWITSSRSFGNISDDDLCRIIRDIRETWPKSGYRIVQGCLRARGLGSNTSELEV